jgi:hypothetical protein
MVTLISVACFMLYGPIFGQMLGGKNRLFRPWEMFKDRGSDMCALTYTLRAADGGEHRIDYMNELGYDSWRTKSKKYKRINSRKEANRLTRRLCKRLEADGPVDLRLDLMCGGEDGWEAIYQGEKSACRQG